MTTSVAPGAALMRPRTAMVFERSAPSEGAGQPSILAALRAWCAEHPLRPDDGSPQSLCDPTEIPIVWAQAPDRDIPLPRLRAPREQAVEEAAADAFVAALEQLREAGQDVAATESGRTALYRAALECRPETLRRIFARLVERTSMVMPSVQAMCWLLEHATHGEAIELAATFLGLLKDRRAVNAFRCLGRHPWLWDRAIWGLDRLGADALDLLWARIYNASCCSRRRLLREIAPRLGDRPDIRDWILRHGLTSWPGDPYIREAIRDKPFITESPFSDCVVVACAVAGDLAGALVASDVDDELLDAACNIISHSFGEMREEDLETYPDGVVAVDRLIGHLLDRCDTLPRLGVIYHLLCWLGRSCVVPASVSRSRFPDRWDEDTEARTWRRLESLGWTEEVRDSLTDDCLRILRRPRWPALVRETFAHYDTASYQERWVAWQVAPIVGVDLMDDAIGWLERMPLDSTLCGWLLETDDTTRVERVIRLADQVVPRAARDALADNSDMKPRRRVGVVLEFLLQAMVWHPVYSERLVALALRHSSFLNGRVIRVLEQRSPVQWGDEVAAALHIAAAVERSEETRERLLGLLEQARKPR